MSRLTKKIENPQYMNDYELLVAHNYHLYNKLGKIEDLMEQYNINDLAELKIALDIINTSDDEKFIKDSRAYFDKYKINPVSVLQQLVDKETPMKVIANPSGKSKRYKYLCPNCKDYLFEANSQTMRFMKDEKRYNHCAYCGQKIDWSDEDED